MRAAALAISIVFCVAALIGQSDLAWLGFPDGHLTAYERETRTLRMILMYGNAIAGVAALAVALHLVKLTTFVLWVASLLALSAITLSSTILPICPTIDLCVRMYEAASGNPMDHGVGG